MTKENSMSDRPFAAPGITDAASLVEGTLVSAPPPDPGGDH
jgi:hypothetical protein